jgi:hypothetical protein
MVMNNISASSPFCIFNLNLKFESGMFSTQNCEAEIYFDGDSAHRPNYAGAYYPFPKLGLATESRDHLPLAIPFEELTHVNFQMIGWGIY